MKRLLLLAVGLLASAASADTFDGRFTLSSVELEDSTVITPE